MFRTESAGFHLHPAEAFPDAWHRITSDIVTVTAGQLRRPDAELDTAVHEARKNLKRLRALLRLVRDSMPDAGFRAEHEALRDIGRSLAPARDARVLLETLAALYDRYDGLVADGAFAGLDRALTTRHREVRRALAPLAVDAVSALLAAGARLRSLDPLSTEFDDVGRNLRRVYRTASRRMRAAAETGHPSRLHGWRKRVKDLRYELEFLEPLQPALIGAQVDELDRLGELLGLDHDLVVLADTVMAESGSGSSDRERWLIIALTHEWRSVLQRQAMPLGAAVHAETARAFGRRLGGYWEASRS